MKAFICEVDHTGLRRLLPEDVLASDGLAGYARRQFERPTTVVWALLAEEDAEVLRTELTDGHHGAACGLLLSWAVELIPLGAAAPVP